MLLASLVLRCPPVSSSQIFFLALSHQSINPKLKFCSMATVTESVTQACDPIANASVANGPRANSFATEGANSEHCVPTAPEEITASWLGGILGLPVKSFTITSSIQNEDTSKLFITLTYADGATADDTSRLRPDRLCLKGSFNPAKLATPGYTEVLKLR